MSLEGGSNEEEGKKVVRAKRRKGEEDVLEAGASNHDPSTCCRLHAPRLMRTDLTCRLRSLLAIA